MTKQIFIATNTHGRGVRLITSFDGKGGLFDYAAEITACTSDNVTQSMSIGEILDILYDRGMGNGARHHHRVSRKEAIEYIRAGAKNDTWLNI